MYDISEYKDNLLQEDTDKFDGDGDCIMNPGTPRVTRNSAKQYPWKPETSKASFCLSDQAIQETAEQARSSHGEVLFFLHH